MEMARRAGGDGKGGDGKGGGGAGAAQTKPQSSYRIVYYQVSSTPVRQYASTPVRQYTSVYASTSAIK